MSLELESINSAQTLSEVFIKSGFFKRGVTDVNQATVKILAGIEIGVPAIAAMRGIDIVDGQITMRAHLMAGLIKNSGYYDYRVTYSDSQRCEIMFEAKRDGQWRDLGTVIFTMEDAKRAGLTSKKPWQQYPAAMLYNRCMSNGAKMHCPAIFLGPVYLPGEIGDSSDEQPDENQVITVVPQAVTPLDDDDIPAIPMETWPPAENPISDEDARGWGLADETEDSDDPPVIHEATPKQVGFLCSLLKDRGVHEGDKKALIAVTLGDPLDKGLVSEQIDSLTKSEILPKLWMNTYVRCLRDIHGVSADSLLVHLESAFGVNNPGSIETLKNQSALIKWLRDHPKVEESGTEEVALKEKWIDLISDLEMKTGRSHADINAWMMSSHRVPDGEAYASIMAAGEKTYKLFSNMGAIVIAKAINDNKILSGDEWEEVAF